MLHHFRSSLATGEALEHKLDKMFAGRWNYRIEPATRDEQRSGIDRHFRHGGKHWTVEYKADFGGVTTGAGQFCRSRQEK